MTRKKFAVMTVTISLGLLAFLLFTIFRGREVIDTFVVSTGDIESSISAYGAIQPSNMVEVGAQASGVIQRLKVRAGDVVKKGQLLVEIDPSIQFAKVEASKASLNSVRYQMIELQSQSDFAKAQLIRQNKMASEGATRAEDVERAQAAFDAASAKVKSLNAQVIGLQSTLKGEEAQLGYTRVTSPINGTVVSLDVREGQTLNATYQTPTILKVADLSVMTVWASVSEVDIDQIKIGMPVYFYTLSAQNAEKRRWEAHVARVLPAPLNVSANTQGSQNSASGATTSKLVTYTVLFDVKNEDYKLMPQMSAQVFFVTKSAKKVVVAPIAALEPIAGSARLKARVLVGGKIVQREVTIGAQDRVFAEVLSGLAVGESLVTGAHEKRLATGKFAW